MNRLSENLALHGYRLTKQREVVFESLCHELDHPTADQVFARVRQELPTVSLATIYNCLDSLVECRLVRQIHFSKQASRYCPVPEVRIHHAHFLNTESGEVVDITLPQSVLDGLKEALPEGTSIERLEITLSGVVERKK
ncbi:MAG: Fur family transcriptional regulator [Puniceicoccaceae bacterium]